MAGPLRPLRDRGPKGSSDLGSSDPRLMSGTPPASWTQTRANLSTNLNWSLTLSSEEYFNIELIGDMTFTGHAATMGCGLALRPSRALRGGRVAGRMGLHPSLPSAFLDLTGVARRVSGGR